MRRADRRDAIIQGTADLVWSHGLEAVTVRSVAEYLGCSRGNVHHTFNTLDELLGEALWAVWQRLSPLYVLDQERPFDERVVGVLVGTLDAEANLIADRIWRDALAAAKMHESIGRVLKKAMFEWLEVVRETLERGRAEGDLPEAIDVETLARGLMAVAMGQDIIADVLDGKNSFEKQSAAVLGYLRNEIQIAQNDLHREVE